MSWIRDDVDFGIPAAFLMLGFLELQQNKDFFFESFCAQTPEAIDRYFAPMMRKAGYGDAVLFRIFPDPLRASWLLGYLHPKFPRIAQLHALPKFSLISKDNGEHVSLEWLGNARTYDPKSPSSD